MQTLPIAMLTLMQTVKAKPRAKTTLGRCLGYPDIATGSPAYNRLAHQDFARWVEANPEVTWDDYCPAYALGLLTYEAYHGPLSLSTEAELKLQWAESHGESKLTWPQARAIIALFWKTLRSTPDISAR